MSDFRSQIQDPRRQKALKVRQQVERGIRNFFDQCGFQEVRTPLLVSSPGMEVHIRPFRLESGDYLPTSPEFAMKKLLAGGLQKIYQICPAFRLEPKSLTHLPEFTLLEWYEAGASTSDLMVRFETLVETLSKSIHGDSKFKFKGRMVDVTTPWERVSVQELFLKFAEVDLTEDPSRLVEHVKRLGLNYSQTDSWDDLFFRIWLEKIEPKLPLDRAVFVHSYPPSQCALAKIIKDENGHPWADRFEPFVSGLEIGNAFGELTDPKEQRKRFEKDMKTRAEIYGESFPPSPIDEEFMRALTEGLPSASGIAVGVDRLIMALADEPDISYTFWLP